MSVMGFLFLTSDELKELTDLKIPKAQMRWLDKHHYPYEISASGRPKVLRAYLNERLKTSVIINRNSEPNFDAIR